MRKKSSQKVQTFNKKKEIFQFKNEESYMKKKEAEIKHVSCFA